MSIEKTLEYIHKTKWLGSKPGLSRTFTLLEKVGRPDRKLKFVHVVGTNGKGSTCAILSSVLQNAGYKVGLYTSPYINCFNERMRVNGQNISDNELCELVDFIRPLADSMTDDAPTEFEMITVLAMEYFARQKCDIVVLEAGMGGELDSTNVIDSPECAVMCAIGLDHVNVLGKSVEEIAKTKSGVIKSKTSVAMYDAQQSVYDTVKARCNEVGAKLVTADFYNISNVRTDIEKTVFDYGEYKNLEIHLAGVYQKYNAALAVTAVKELRQKGWNISDEAIYKGLSRAVWQGRFEILGKAPLFVLDGAHNVHGMTATRDSLKTHFPDTKIHFVVGAMADKDVEGMMSLIVPMAERVYAVSPDNDRAMSAKDLCKLLQKLGADAVFCDSIEEAVWLAIENAGQSGVVAALGSLYFSGDIRRAYNKITGRNV